MTITTLFKKEVITGLPIRLLIDPVASHLLPAPLLVPISNS